MAKYKYEVLERTFKENLLMKEGDAFESDELYNSRALKPADEATTKAVEKLKAEHDALRKKADPISTEEAASLRVENAELKKKLDAILAKLDAKK